METKVKEIKQLPKLERLAIAQQTLKRAETMTKVSFLPKSVKEELWQLLLFVEHDQNRILIAENDIDNESLTLWLEDRYSSQYTVIVEIPLNAFSKVILADALSTYEAGLMNSEDGVTMRPANTPVRNEVQYTEPIKWYNELATKVQCQWAREAMLKSILTKLVEDEGGLKL